MPQPGFHALLALAFRDRFTGKAPFGLGLVVGSALPDLDGYVSGAMVLLGRATPQDAEALYHRTWSHSLLFAAGVWALCFLFSLLGRYPGLRSFGLAAALGIVLFHIVPDLFLWFDKVGVFWPFLPVNLWKHHVPFPYEHSVLQAGNFLGFAAFLGYLAVLCRRVAPEYPYLRRVLAYAWIELGLGATFLALAFLIPEAKFALYSGTALLGFAFPNTLWVIWRLRSIIR